VFSSVRIDLREAAMDPLVPDVPEIPHTATTPETHTATPEVPAAYAAIEAGATQPVAAQQPAETRFLLWVLLGKQGLRAGWSVVLFVLLFGLFFTGVGFVFVKLNLVDQKNHFTASAALFGELIPFLAMVAAAAIVALVERRRGNLLAFNLMGPHRARHFVEGLVAGFVALSALIGGLAWGRWLHFGAIALSGVQIAEHAAVWGIAFLLVGCVEEGLFRCFLQSTLTRGINFWWALGIVGSICAILLIFGKGNGIWGVYILAALGFVPCLLLQLNKAESAGFWQAAWVTSTLFGYIHTGNNGENWIGIFAAAAIGFVFVVSIRVTGSAWWAIGCHAAWDWAETYFYGAADSGNVATGHYLSVTPAGSAFWSGGTDGPEGSVLVLAVILLLLAALVAIYGRRKSSVVMHTEQLEQAAG
jgi:membrane protease YdiL (CAAX protease family)